MRPPDDPPCAAALATADAILGADDLDVAASLLTPWTELTPRDERRAARLAGRPHRHDPYPDPPGDGRPPRTGACPTTSTPPERTECVCRSTCWSSPSHPARAVRRASRRRVRLQRSHGAPVRVALAGLSPPGRGPGPPPRKRWACPAPWARAAPAPVRRQCSFTADEWRTRIWRAGEESPAVTAAPPKPRSATGST